MSVSGILLAAGRSLRFGDEAKQLLDFDGEPLVRRIARAACLSTLGEVVVVTGYRASEMEAALEGLGVRTILNPRYRDGLSTSIGVGIQNVTTCAGGALIMTADQPFLSTEVMDQIVSAYAGTGAAIVGPVFEGRHGSPVLFDRSLFVELLELRNDEGGRQIIQRSPGMLEAVELGSALPLTDIDTRAEYERLLGYTSAASYKF